MHNAMQRSWCLLMASATLFLQAEGILAQELSADDRACIVSAVANLPNIPALKVERSRALPQSQAQGRRNPDQHQVTVELDVSALGESSTYVFNCIRDGQLTVIQPMGRSPGSLAQDVSAEDRACITSAISKLPEALSFKIERSRVLLPRRNPDLYQVTVEIDVSVVGQTSTYIFNCIRKGQLTVIQPMGMR
jgi:hypothetical protein